MSVYEPSSPDSDSQCYSPGSCEDDSVSTPSRKYKPIDKSKRLKASARERKRRHVLNSALESLRGKVACVNQNSHKLSKIEVLRLAIDYIAMLSCYLDATADTSRTDHANLLSLQQQHQSLFSPYSGMAPQHFGGLAEDFRKQVSSICFSIRLLDFLVFVGLR